MTTSTQNPQARRTVNTRQNAQNAAPVAAPTVQEPAKPTSRKKPVTWKDLTIKFMMNGVDGITPDLNEAGDPVGSLDKMIEELSINDQDTVELVKLRDHYAALNAAGSPGRQPVKIGESREYSVQQAGEEGDLFVRIPLSTLAVQRGEKIVAEFGDDGIKIHRLG